MLPSRPPPLSRTRLMARAPACGLLYASRPSPSMITGDTMSSPPERSQGEYFRIYAFNAKIVDSGLVASMKGSDLKVLIVLMRRMDTKTRQSFPSLERIEKESGIERGTVQEAIKRLVASGVILKHRFSSGRKWKNVFTISDNPKIVLPIQPKKSARWESQNREHSSGRWVKPKNSAAPIQPNNPQNSYSQESRLASSFFSKATNSERGIPPPPPMGGDGRPDEVGRPASRSPRKR